MRSLLTIKGSKTVAAIANAICYGFYSYVIILTAGDGIPIITKCLITAFCNLVAVWIVKFIEEKSRKDKLWLVKITVPKDEEHYVKSCLKYADVPFSYIDIEKYIIFDTYCKTQADTAEVAKICKSANGKMFATENKL